MALAKGEVGVGEEMDCEFGLSRYKLGLDKQGPAVEHRELYSVSFSFDKP